MSLILHRQLPPKGELGIWTIEEPESFFLEKIELFPEEKRQIQAMKGRRRLEWLAARYLLHYMSGREVRGACLIDEFGKPHLEKSSFQISLSHSHERVAVLAAPGAVGIDIQVLVEKIGRIAYKFMREEELESLQMETKLEHLHVYWGAKEALYKAYGRRELDFREHLLIEPFAYDPAGGKTSGTIRKEDFTQAFEVHYERLDDYMLTWVLEK
jgi:phosphopantetheinyl transferase